jgi:hypothetical protein
MTEPKVEAELRWLRRENDRLREERDIPQKRLRVQRMSVTEDASVSAGVMYPLLICSRCASLNLAQRTCVTLRGRARHPAMHGQESCFRSARVMSLLDAAIP